MTLARHSWWARLILAILPSFHDTQKWGVIVWDLSFTGINWFTREPHLWTWHMTPPSSNAIVQHNISILNCFDVVEDFPLLASSTSWIFPSCFSTVRMWCIMCQGNFKPSVSAVLVSQIRIVPSWCPLLVLHSSFLFSSSLMLRTCPVRGDGRSKNSQNPGIVKIGLSSPPPNPGRFDDKSA